MSLQVLKEFLGRDSQHNRCGPEPFLPKKKSSWQTAKPLTQAHAVFSFASSWRVWAQQSKLAQKLGLSETSLCLAHFCEAKEAGSTLREGEGLGRAWKKKNAHGDLEKFRL